MSDPVPRWQDAWSSRFPADYVQGDLTPADLAAWRAMCRQEESNGYIVPHTTTPTAPIKHGREMDNCPSLRWMRGRV
jgi:hypothetical protein